MGLIYFYTWEFCTNLHFASKRNVVFLWVNFISSPSRLTKLSHFCPILTAFKLYKNISLVFSSAISNITLLSRLFCKFRKKEHFPLIHFANFDCFLLFFYKFDLKVDIAPETMLAPSNTKLAKSAGLTITQLYNYNRSDNRCLH